MVLKGKRSAGIKLRRRSSAGSSSSARAAVSISRSMAKHASGRPAPRYAATGAVLVSAPVDADVAARDHVGAGQQPRVVPRRAGRRVHQRGAQRRDDAGAQPEDAPVGVERQLALADRAARVVGRIEILAPRGDPLAAAGRGARPATPAAPPRDRGRSSRRSRRPRRARSRAPAPRDISSRRATSPRMRNGAWHETQSVSSSRGRVEAWPGRCGAPWPPPRSAPARCAAAPGARRRRTPRRVAGVAARGGRSDCPRPRRRATAAPLASAASGGPRRTARRTRPRAASAASHAALALSATIATTGTPTACTTPSAMIGCGGTLHVGDGAVHGHGPEVPHLVAGDHGHHAGRRADRLDVEAGDARVTVGRADEDDRESAGRPQIVDEAAGAEEQAAVFAPLHRPPDVGVGRARRGPWGAGYFPPMVRYAFAAASRIEGCSFGEFISTRSVASDCWSPCIER